jgi:hypothetical protein
MFTKHFFKTLILFSGMIVVGLLGIFLVSHYGTPETDSGDTSDIAN